MEYTRTTYYKKKRQASGLSKMDMANELGLNYGRYVSIEKGDVKMPSNLIDKFNEIINRGKENEITRVENNINANEFWEEMKSVNEKGERRLYDKMREYNITSINELADLLGYKSTGTIYSHLTGSSDTSDEFKKRIYTFFHDETNIKIPTKSNELLPANGKNKHRVVDKTLDKYYEKTDFRKILKENKITNLQIAQAIGVHNSTVSNMTRKKTKPGYEIIANVKKYLDNILNTSADDIQLPKAPNIEPKLPEIPRMEPKDMVPNYFVEEKKSTPNDVVTRYKTELSEIDDVIAMYRDKIKDLEVRKKVCIEVLNVIDELDRIQE